MVRNEILFIDINGGSRIDFCYSLGAGYIQAYLASKGIGSLQFKCKQSYSLGSLVDQILSLEISVVGFTCYEINYPYVFMLANALKNRKNDIMIIAGGPSPTFADEVILKDCKAIDICVRGEGEYTVYDILIAIKEGRPLTDIKGISSRSNGRLIRTPERELISSGIPGAELDIIPSPYLSGVIPLEETLKNAVRGIITARGCPYRCTYCNCSIIGRARVRFHSAQRVIEELTLLWKAAKSRGALSEIISIYDDTFTITPKRTREICKRIIEAKLEGIKIWVETRADKLDFETIDLLHKTGVKELSIGLESAVPRILNRIQKVREGQCGEKDNYTAEKKYIRRLGELVRYAKKIGIAISISMMQGLPGESYKDVKKTVNFIKSLGVDKFFQNRLDVIPGTELFINAHKYGLNLKKMRRGNLHFIIENPPPSIYYPMVSSVQRDLQFLCQNLPSAFRMFCHTFYGLTNGPPQEIVILNSARLPYNFLNWVNTEATVNAMVSFICGSFTEKDIEENFASILEDSFLSFPLRYFIENNSTDGFRTLTMRRESFHFDWKLFEAPKFYFIPLSLYNCINTPTLPSYRHNNYIIFTLEKAPDVKELIEISKSFDNRGKLIIPKSLSRFVPSLEDECRWSDTPCPAVFLSKMFVNRKGGIYTCLKGKIVGKVGESIGEIRSRLKSLMEKEKILRGCAQCALQEQCSKCLFPYPIDRKEYCQIRRTYPNIHLVALTMKIPRSVLQNSKYEFSPQRLLTMFKKVSEKKDKNLDKNKQVSCPPELLSLYKILKEARKHIDDILLFQWGNSHCMGFRRHSYSDYLQEPLEIYRVSSQSTEVISELLWRRSAGEALFSLKQKYKLNKHGREQIGQLLKFIKDTYSPIQKSDVV